MKTVKLKLFDRIEFTENTLKNVPVAGSEDEESKFLNGLKKEKSNILLAFNKDEMKVDFLLQITLNNEVYASMFYNPVLTFLKQSYDTNSKAETIKANMRVVYNNNDIKIVDIRDFSSFMQLKLNAIIMLQTSIEAFLNYSIPQRNYSYKDTEISKEKIEKSLSFRDKLKFISNDMAEINFNIQNKEDKDIYDSFLNLNSVRKEIIHIKTNRQEFMEKFIEHLRESLDLDLEVLYEKTISFMNKIKPNFIELININNDIQH